MYKLFSVLFILSIYTHDIQVAYFKIQKVDQTLELEFIFEKNDLTKELELLGSDISDAKLMEYATSHFSLSINTIPQDIVFQSIRVREKHIDVVGSISNVNEVIRTVDIRNTCLSNIENQSNIIQVHLHDKQRDFLMNKDRTSISIAY